MSALLCSKHLQHFYSYGALNLHFDRTLAEMKLLFNEYIYFGLKFPNACVQ
jgi:hypothetical protein